MASDAEMKPLEDYLEWLEPQIGQRPTRFDEKDGGVRARVLMLHNFPTEGMKKATRENTDRSAYNVRTIHEGVLDRRLTISWNAVPYYFEKKPSKAERDACDAYLEELLRRLDKLQVVMLCGGLAWEKRGCVEAAKPCVVILETNHPGDQGLYGQHGYDEYVAAVRRAAEIVGPYEGEKTA